jgi:hypothetical protein
MSNIDLRAAAEDLKKLRGLPPYNTPSNTCWGDGYFAASLRKKYGVSIEELERLTGVR